VGLNRGMAGSAVTGLDKNPVKDDRPTLAAQGIDKNLAHQARTLGALSDETFERAGGERTDVLSAQAGNSRLVRQMTRPPTEAASVKRR
jgi:hypothetical protein